MPGGTTNELSVRLSPSSVCSSPAFIAIPSCAGLNPPILSSVAGSEHMDHGTLPSATLRPRIVCSDRYERPAAAERTRCARIAACTLALCPFPHDCSIVTCVIVHRSAPRPLRFVRATRIACSGLAPKQCMSEHPTRSSCSTCYPSARRCLGCVCVLASSKIILQSESLGGCERP